METIRNNAGKPKEQFPFAFHPISWGMCFVHVCTMLQTQRKTPTLGGFMRGETNHGRGVCVVILICWFGLCLCVCLLCVLIKLTYVYVYVECVLFACICPKQLKCSSRDLACWSVENFGDLSRLDDLFDCPIDETTDVRWGR